MMMKSSSCALCAVNKSDEKSPLKKGPPLFVSPSSSSFFFLIFETLNKREEKKEGGGIFSSSFYVSLFCSLTQHNTQRRLSSVGKNARACERSRRETTL